MGRKQQREAVWADAKRRCRLNDETVRMAKELGISPEGLIRNIPDRTQQWKAPVHVWIRELYEKSLRKQAAKRARKAGGAGDDSAESANALPAPSRSVSNPPKCGRARPRRSGTSGRQSQSPDCPQPDPLDRVFHERRTIDPAVLESTIDGDHVDERPF